MTTRKWREYTDNEPICKYGPCQGVAIAKGYCHGHNRQRLAGKGLRPINYQHEWIEVDRSTAKQRYQELLEYIDSLTT